LSTISRIIGDTSSYRRLVTSLRWRYLTTSTSQLIDTAIHQRCGSSTPNGTAAHQHHKSLTIILLSQLIDIHQHGSSLAHRHRSSSTLINSAARQLINIASHHHYNYKSLTLQLVSNTLIGTLTSRRGSGGNPERIHIVDMHNFWSQLPVMIQGRHLWRSTKYPSAPEDWLRPKSFEMAVAL
jgi:hypothetical protein